MVDGLMPFEEEVLEALGVPAKASGVDGVNDVRQQTYALPHPQAAWGRTGSSRRYGEIGFDTLARLVAEVFVVPPGRRSSFASAGGRGDLLVVVTALRVDGMGPGSYLFSGQATELRRVPTAHDQDAVLTPLLEYLGPRATRPAAVVHTLSYLPYLTAKYPGRAVAAALWNAGMIMQRLGDVAEDLHLSYCSIGATLRDVDAVLPGSGWDQIVNTGNFAVGSRSMDDLLIDEG
jgi:hypothetical protein